MLIKKVKQFIKKNFPEKANKLISLRDNNPILRFLRSFKFLISNKEIHGKKIVLDKSKVISFYDPKNFISYSFRPKNSKSISPKISYKKEEPKYAIIIQGPIKNYEEFCIETLKIYNKIFPDCLKILSTWENELNQKYIDQIQKLNRTFLIINEKPKSIYNVDLQIISTNNALKFAENNKINFSLKTRTDCRIYNRNSLDFLIKLKKTFENETNKNDRILASSIDTRIYRIYGLTDICIFGSTKQLLKYFENTNYLKSLEKMNINPKVPLINETAVINEIFLCARYLNLLKLDAKWTLKDWWEKCRDLFCIFDTSSIDLFWYKYHWEYEQRLITNYSSNSNQCMQFNDWLNLYHKNYEIFDIANQEKWILENGLAVQKN